MQRRHRADPNSANIQFQQDGAPPHRGRIVRDWFNRNHVDVMEWPAMSPDLSPIENCWDLLGRRVAERVTERSTVGDLERFLIEEWARIPQFYINNLIGSMRRRCEACVRANGGSTKY